MVPHTQIIFNNKVVSPGFQHNGIAVSRVGIKMYVTIPEIGVQVMFSGLIFSVEVPFSTFANNTEGQCGEPAGDPGSMLAGEAPGAGLQGSCGGTPGSYPFPLGTTQGWLLRGTVKPGKGRGRAGPTGRAELSGQTPARAPWCCRGRAPALPPAL